MMVDKLYSQVPQLTWHLNVRTSPLCYYSAKGAITLYLLHYTYADLDGNSRRKRQEFAEGVTYKDFFPEYPPGIRIRKDVANFVSLRICTPKETIILTLSINSTF